MSVLDRIVDSTREACTSGAATATLDSYVGLSVELAG